MTDILTDSIGDLLIENGDLVTGYSDLQHQEHLLLAQKGDFKEQPTVGVGIENFLNSSDVDEFLSEVKSEFIKDAMAVTKLDFDEATGNLNYDANY
jgi:hypothetical protein